MKALPSGLMIQDNRLSVSLQVKLADCCQKFKDRFGRWPSTIWLHEKTLGDYGSNLDGLKLEVSQYCQPGIFLVGPLSEAEPATGGSGEGV